MKAILSADENWGIGLDNGLLARVPEDMKFFKSQTLGKVVVMGRKTFESLPGKALLKNRVNIILTRDKNFAQDGAIVLNSVEEVLKESKKYESEDFYIIGGEQVYNRFLPYCDEVYVTKFLKSFEADSFFTNLDEEVYWQLASESEEKEYEGLKYKFTVYKNHDVREVK